MSLSNGVVALFPGQGSQYAGMAVQLKEHFPWTKTIFEEASDAIKTDLLELCNEGPDSVLQLTRNAQPAILVTSYAWLQAARREFDLKSTAAAGHSLGEYSALLSVGALTLAEAVVLVRQRGEFMQSAVPEGEGKMAAVLGLDEDKITELCRRASEGEKSLVVPANFNAPGQVVIAGHAAAVERAQAISVSEPALKARKFIPLKVSAPFHSPLMKPVAERFEPFLKSVKWQKWQSPVACNVDGILRAEGDPVALLTQQIDHPVLWTKCTRALHAPNAKQLFLEMGPGKVLNGLVKRILDNVTTLSVDSIDDFRNLGKALEEVSR